MKKLTKDYNLQALYPDIAKEWHPTKNGDLKPSQVFPKTNKKVWWICKERHEYKTSISLKTTKKSGCPYCTNQKVGYGNDLETNYPDIAKEWHPKKNGDLKPKDIVPGSQKKVWWKCNRDHEWIAMVLSRCDYNSNCPKCSGQTSKPELYIFAEMSSIFNDVVHRKKIKNVEIDIFIKDLNLAIEYDGRFYHSSRIKKDIDKRKKLTKKYNMINIREHPLELISVNDISYKNSDSLYSLVVQIMKNILISNYCTSNFKQKIKEYLKDDKPWNEGFYNEMVSYLPGPKPSKSIFSKFPDIAKEWHPTKNGNLYPSNFHAHSDWEAWWVCKKNHEWQAPIKRRTSSKSGCPYCTNQKVGYGNDLETNYPDIAKEWHPKKNGDLKPSQVFPVSSKKIWWICKEGHEFDAQIQNRTIKKTGCRYCSNYDVGYGNDLQANNPNLAKLWHPTKNGDLKPNQITPNSSKVIWWRCKKGHEWKEQPNSIQRTKFRCKKCKGFTVYKNGKKIGFWNKHADCAKDLGLYRNSITKCLNGRLKTYKGYTFEYKKNDI